VLYERSCIGKAGGEQEPGRSRRIYDAKRDVNRSVSQPDGSPVVERYESKSGKWEQNECMSMVIRESTSDRGQSSTVV